ncbi:MAG: hypothetical protein U1D06_02905 [Paracoccaceae bacterium]|nr:hypothetical protein [Paracoccaceae bacterium]
MTNSIALVLGALILAMIGLDHFANDGTAGLFLLRKFANFLEYLSFWR